MGPVRTLPTSTRTCRWKRPEIQFQQESSLETVPDTGTPDTTRGELVAEFYRSITSTPSLDPETPEVMVLDSEPEPVAKDLCPVCGLPLPSSAKLRRRHNASTAHLAKVVDTRPTPVKPLHINRQSYGYKVLSSQGWSDRDRHGIGAEGNEGRREPVKASRVKNDTVGLGIKGKKIKEAVEVKKDIASGKDIQKAYERDKQIRKELMEYMYR